MSTQAEVQVSYDVGNEFFRLWLDKRMNYTCGIYDETDDLDEAQIAKLNFLHDYSKITQEGSILDIGCGWGANIEFLARDKGVKDVHGITLSPAQFDEINSRKIPNVTAHCVNYLDYKPDRLFDAVISICMIEHVVTPEQARSGEHIDLYRNYFRLAHEWTKPGAHFALQTILRNRAPRNRKDIQDIGWMTYEIFPGGITPRLEDIVIAVNPYWEVKQVTTRRVDYQKTCAHWLEGLKRSEDFICEKWGSQVFEDYDRYLSTCVRAFEMHYQSLAQWQLKRID
jgi:cyclopropane-fatty-acyl-phospholipid synthase